MEMRNNQLSEPFQPPDWRWRLAVDLAEDTTGRFRPCADPAVKFAKRFWRLWLDCRSEADRRLLAARMPTVYQAFRLYSDPHGSSRSALEARILAGEAPETIAAKSAISVAMVRAYERLFYNVRGFLKNPDYILNRVLRPRLRDPSRDWDDDLVWKFFGYIGGPLVLDEIMGACSSGTRPVDVAGVAAFFTEDTQAALRRQLAIAARALRGADRKTAAALIQADGRRAGRKGEDEDSPNILTKHIAALIDEIPWDVGEDAEKQLPPGLAEYDRGAAELRDEEIFRLALGQEPKELKAVKEFKMPPPPKSEPNRPKK
jgi:hypothetical protein